MKYILNIHSFVDLITNSSSELFVATGYKSLETLKEIAYELIPVDFDLIFGTDIVIVDESNLEHYQRYYELPLLAVGSIIIDIEPYDELRMAIIEDYLWEPLNLKKMW